MKTSGTIDVLTPPLDISKKKQSTRSNYYVVIAVVALGVVLGGFTLTYLVPMTTTPSFTLRPMVHLHGIMYFAWMLLFILQPVLVRNGNTKLHKKIGVAGFILAGAMVIVGVTTAVTGARLNSPTLAVGGLTPQQFLIVPLTDMLLFVIYLGLSVGSLKNHEAHKRLMVLATLALLPAAFGRIATLSQIENPAIIIVLTESLLLAAIAFDYIAKRKIHAVYKWGGALMIIVHFVRFPLGSSGLWASVSEWILR
jgi:hypothetical protein